MADDIRELPGRTKKQMRLPRLRLEEAAASLAYVLMADRDQIKWTHEARQTHLENVVEFLRDSHTVTEEDLLPF